MKAEYDFSEDERGKFYHPDAEFHLPVYLDPDVAEFMSGLAAKKKINIGEMVNDWLRRDIEFIKTVKL
jgi:hypothetical protein